MSSIVDDIFNDIEVKPKKSKIVIKWIVRISIFLISGAFIYGQWKTSHNYNLDSLNSKIEQNNSDFKSFKEITSLRFDKVYEDFYSSINYYQQYNNKQLLLIVDYGYTEKSLLKKMIELNSSEMSRNFQFQIEHAKSESQQQDKLISSSITKRDQYIEIIKNVDVNNDTTFIVVGCLFEYAEGIDKTKYDLLAVDESTKYKGLYNITFKNKK